MLLGGVVLAFLTDRPEVAPWLTTEERTWLTGELTREQALQAAQQAHRNYAKRQMTWFRREPEVHWLHGFGDEAQVQREATVRTEASFATDDHG